MNERFPYNIMIGYSCLKIIRVDKESSMASKFKSEVVSMVILNFVLNLNNLS